MAANVVKAADLVILAAHDDRAFANDVEAEVNDSTAVVISKQVYRSDIHQDSGLKTLRLRWHRGRWTIYRETWKPLTDQG